MSEQQKVEMKINYEKSKLEKLYVAKELFEQDSKRTVEIDIFIDTLVEAFLSYRKLRGASESQLLQKIASKEDHATV
jgi:hypothetical protein